MLADIQRGSKLKKVPPRSKPHALVLVAPPHALVLVAPPHALVLVVPPHALVLVARPHALVLVASSRRRRARYSVVRSQQS